MPGSAARPFASPRRHRRRAGARRGVRRRAGASVTAATASSTSAASATTSTAPAPAASSARTPAAEHRVVVDDHDADRAWRSGRSVTVVLLSSSGRCSRTSVPSPGVERISAVPPCRCHPVDDAVAQPEPVLGHRVAGRSRRPGRARTRPPPRRCTSAYTSTRPVPACLAALVTASRVARRRPAAAPRRTAQSPTATTSTETPWASSTSAADRAQRTGDARSSVDSSAYSHARRSRSWARASRAT